MIIDHVCLLDLRFLQLGVPAAAVALGGEARSLQEQDPHVPPRLPKPSRERGTKAKARPTIGDFLHE